MDIVKSPMYYMGNKYRLIEQLKNYIPTDIETFHDLFGGSGTVGINFVKRSKRIVYNELLKTTFDMFKFLIETPYNEIHNFIISKQNEFKLDTQDGYYACRDYINENNLENDPKWCYLLTHFSFCNQMEKNLNGKINISFGNRVYKPDIVDVNLNHIQYWLKKVKYDFFNLSLFDYIENQNIENGDYVYLDPPYLNTTAVYSRGAKSKNWTMDDELKMLEFCESLNSRGILFGISNIANRHLISWAEKNNFNIVKLNITYTGQSNGARDHQEVFITNYSINQQLSLF